MTLKNDNVLITLGAKNSSLLAFLGLSSFFKNDILNKLNIENYKNYGDNTELTFALFYSKKQ